MTTSAKPAIIIGLAGTLASGKDTVGSILADDHGFLHISTSEMLRAAKRKAYGDSPKALLLRNDPFANKLRQDRGPGVLAEEAIAEYRKCISDFPYGLVVSGIRSIGEVEVIKQSAGTMIFVDAQPAIRYQRTISRSRDDNEQNKTFEEFMAMEQAERPNNNDKTVQNLTAVKQMSDIHIENNGNDLGDFKKQIEAALVDVIGRR